MKDKKARLNSKSLSSSVLTPSKPSTITRAAITAEIKPTRGKQLVEHDPILLIPDPFNPRPGERINDCWLKKYLHLGADNYLCRLEKDGTYFIPSFIDLDKDLSQDLEEDYEFLRSLAFSLRNDGLIEPIEIFLADRNNDPEYFSGSQLEYGYVVLEGHQRRLAAIMGGLKAVTCIELTDETMLARLKVKHRKLRRQLSENNLRKGLTVGQNFIILKKLLESMEDKKISVKELSNIIGLNEEIAGSLRRIILNPQDFPDSMYQVIEQNRVTFKWIRAWVNKNFEDIGEESKAILEGREKNTKPSREKLRARGRNGGPTKKSAVFKVNKESDSSLLRNFLINKIPELYLDEAEATPFHSLERVLQKLLELAKNHEPDPGRI